MAGHFEGIRLDGVKEFRKKTERFDERAARRLWRSALNQSLGPVKTALRRAIKVAGAVRHGHMSKAVVSKVNAYSNTTILLVGVRDKVVADGDNPGKYFHLVSLGTRAHPQPNNRLVGFQHPGSKPRHLRRDALAKGGPKVAAKFMQRAEALLAKEFLKK